MSGNPTNPNDHLDLDNAPDLNPEDFVYYSPRDVDGDGKDDIVHTVDHAGTSALYHLDAAGEPVMRELDTDGDGIFETQEEVLDETTSQFAQDTDGDGAFDTVSYVDTASGARVQQDHYTPDGARVESRLDIDGDGLTDVILADTNGDGEFNEARLDTDDDGWVNTKLVDTNGDGKFDELHYDSDNQDGVLETVLTTDDLPGGLGYVDDFTGYDAIDLGGALDGGVVGSFADDGFDDFDDFDGFGGFGGAF